jgi:Uma2 family endonuclease
MAIGEKHLTVEEFLALYEGKPYELVNGEVREVSPTAEEHGAITTRAIAYLFNFVRPRNLGEVYSSETGFVLLNDARRGADAAFVSMNNLKRIKNRSKFVPFAPDLAVEVISASEKPAEVSSKVNLYLQSGTRIVWVIYPDTKEVWVYRANGTYTVLQEGTLEGEDLFPPDLPQDEEAQP